MNLDECHEHYEETGDGTFYTYDANGLRITLVLTFSSFRIQCKFFRELPDYTGTCEIPEVEAPAIGWFAI